MFKIFLKLPCPPYYRWASGTIIIQKALLIQHSDGSFLVLSDLLLLHPSPDHLS